MSNNLLANVQSAVTAKLSASFVDCALDSSNINIIYETGSALKSWVPGRSINGITGFTAGRGYFINPKANIDLSEVLASPISTGFKAVAPIVMNQEHFNNLVYLDTTGSNSKICNAFCTIEYNTDAASVTIAAVTQLVGRSVTGANGMSVFINDTFLQRITVTANDTIQSFSIDLSSYSGMKNIKIVTSTNDSGWVAVPIRITFPVQSLAIPVYYSRKPQQLVTITDSIGVGVGSTIPEQKGYVPLLRAAQPSWDIVPIGKGGAKLADFFDSSNLATTRARVKMRLTGAVQKRIYIALGTNDYGADVPVSTIQSLLLAALDAFHTDFADVKIWVQTPTTVSTETSDMTDIRAGITSTVNSRGSFCTLVPGPPLVSSAKLVDGTHPSDAGYIDMTTGILATTLFNTQI